MTNTSVGNRVLRRVQLLGYPVCYFGLLMLLSGCVSTAKYAPAIKD